MYVYLITNTINGKQYVGQTIKTIEKRWKQHLRDVKRKTLPHLYAAMHKYGSEKFIVETLHTCENQEELDFSEIFYINFLRTCSPNGYNLAEGGSSGSAHKGHKHSEDTKKLLREKFTGEGNANFGHPHSEAHNQKIREANLKSKPWHHGTSTAYYKYKCGCAVCVTWFRRLHPLKGTHLVTKETRNKMSVAKLGHKDSTATIAKRNESRARTFLKNGGSKASGISKDKNHGIDKWVVRLKVNGKFKRFGMFNTREEAEARAQKVKQELNSHELGSSDGCNNKKNDKTIDYRKEKP